MQQHWYHGVRTNIVPRFVVWSVEALLTLERIARLVTISVARQLRVLSHLHAPCCREQAREHPHGDVPT
jgi:hypothetical protein